MKVIKPPRGIKSIKGPVLTLGNFDGLHLGHRRVLKKVSERARTLGCPSVVYTFDPHPKKVVSPGKGPLLITDLEDKTRLIEELGIDYLVVARFTKEFASIHPDEFVAAELVSRLSVKEVWVGHDYSFGRGKLGTVQHLIDLGDEFGFPVAVVPAYRKKGVIVSSSLVRRLVKAGEVREAAGLLGRIYSIKGRVVRGADMGRAIGFPTANIDVSSELVPGRGVYAAFVTLKGARHRAVVNIGTAPTLGGRQTTVEAHILDFNRSIYGRKLGVGFVRRLRGERKFASKEDLGRQISKDVQRARKLL